MSVTPDEIHEQLRQRGWKAQASASDGRWTASGSDAFGHVHSITSHSEMTALTSLLRYATNQHSHLSSVRVVDPNAEFKVHPNTRVASVREDKLPDMARFAKRYVRSHDAWWTRPRAEQLAKVEDVLRMMDVSLDPEQARRIAEIDLTASNGSGHVFRAFAVEQGLDPRTASKAWVLLAPLASQLALDNESLRRCIRLASTMSHWHYERAISSIRHELGHDHVPLGIYSASLADMLSRSDPRVHEVVSSLMYDAHRVVKALEREASEQAERALLSAQSTFVRVAKVDDAARRKLKQHLKDDKSREFGSFAALKTDVTKRELESFLDDHKDDFPHPNFTKYKKEAVEAFQDFEHAPNISNNGRGVPGR